MERMRAKSELQIRIYNMAILCFKNGETKWSYLCLNMHKMAL